MLYLILSVAECIHSSLLNIFSLSLLIKKQTNKQKTKKQCWWGIECWNGCLI